MGEGDPHAPSTICFACHSGRAGRGRERPRHRVLRGHDRQRFERRHDGRAVRHAAEGGQHRRRGRHGLDPRRAPTGSRRPPPAAPASTSRRAGRRTPTGSSTGPTRARSRSSTSRTCRSRRPATRMGFVVNGELAALQGARDLQRPDEHVLQQRHLGERQRGQRHLRAAEHAPQQRHRDLHRQQERRRPPGAQLRRARQLRSELDRRATGRTPTASASTTRRRARRRSSAAAAPGGTPTTATI